jgi:hypothetical protein
MNKQHFEVLNKLSAGEYILKDPQGKKSVVWEKFEVIVTSDGHREIGYVKCRHCNSVLKHVETTGTSSLSRHLCVRGSSVSL